MNAQLEKAWQVRRVNFPMEIEFDYSLDTALISLTGSYCALDCAHCGGYYLRHMTPIWEVQGKVRGASSCLISGGCDSQGRVPVAQHLEEIKAIRQGRKMNWHVGLIEEEDMRKIAPYADVVSFDFVGNDETIHEVYSLDRGVEDYIKAYEIARKYTKVFPHIIIGLRGGELGHERQALEILGDLGVEGLVFLVLIPTPGTCYVDRKPPSIKSVVNILAEARLQFPEGAIHLGCMRPHGDYRAQLDPLAVKAGVNKIVSPSREARLMAKELGLAIRHGRECCVF